MGRAVKVLTTKSSVEPLLGQFKQESHRVAFPILEDAPSCLGGGRRETESREAAGEGASGQARSLAIGWRGAGQQVNVILGWNWQIWWWELVLEGSDFFQEGGAGPVR